MRIPIEENRFGKKVVKETQDRLNCLLIDLKQPQRWRRYLKNVSHLLPEQKTQQVHYNTLNYKDKRVLE